ncbi:MAG: hypothetical protein E3J67_01485 [Dehalococcoidia bacterium]|nr:MAG: hypothetical protein E3J67_01485 [Dehalococcoidia bacterium]
MKLWIATIVLATLLASGGVFSGIKITDMTRQLNELQLSYTSLESNYNSLGSSYAVLQSNYNSLESDYESLQSSYDVLQGRVSELQFSYDRLEAENRELKRLLDQYENVPHSYYSIEAFPHHSNTYEELCQFLTFEFALPTGYKAHVFDCSESSAYLEWALENAGFDAYIATGRTPWEPSSGYHAWVIAYSEGYRVAIEATDLTGEYYLSYLFAGRIPGIIYGDDPLIPGWENYYEGYDTLLKNIYEAIRSYRTTEEWNWWEGYWGFK